MKKIIQTLILSMTLFFGHVVLADPTVKEIFQTSQTNKEQALSMIDDIIKKHPNSSKAYFVKTELLLSMGKNWLAKETFLKAETLDPKFSYAKPESVTRVRNALGIKPKSESISNQNIIIFCGIVICGILIIWLIVRKRESQPPSYMPNNTNRPITPFHPSPSNTTSAPVQSGSTTSGSGIMGSLATGAAVGVGAVAGAALANHLINGNNSSQPTKNVTPEYTPSSDFGVSSDSWDSSSDSSSSDSSSSDW
jgi:hypothetical protein